MKTKFKFLVKQSLNKKIKTKWFLIANLIIGILLIGIFNLDKIINAFGGDFEETESIYVIDKINVYDEFASIFNNNVKVLDMKDFKLERSYQSEEQLSNMLEENDHEMILVIEEDDLNYLNSKIISYDEVSSLTKELISSALTTLKTSIVVKENNYSEEQLLALTSPANVELKVLNPNASSEDNKDMMSISVIMVLILPCFLLITLLVQMIGAEVNDEKTTRSMEIIISNVSPQVHFSSKIAAGVLFVLIQGSLILLYALIAYLIRILLGGSIISLGSSEIFVTIKEMGIFNTLLKGLPLIIILFIFSFLSYAIVSGVLASMTTSVEDFQQLHTPLMIILVLGYYLSLMASTFNGAIFIKVFSYIPMLSFLISPTLFLLGQVSLLELCITTVISGLFTLIIFKYGLRIYKVGILNYSSEKLWKKIFKSIKEK